MSCAEAAEPIDLQLGCGLGFAECFTSSVVFASWHQCPHGRAHWRHLANMIEPSVCGVSAVLCKITLTTC